MKNILITGAAGFIGYHLARALLERGDRVTGMDNMNEYYDISLKESRLSLLQYDRFSFIKGAIEDRELVRKTILDGNFDAVVHLAAQAGVRYSLTHPEAYISSNFVGFFNMLDACKESGVPHFLYASSSSVYGANEKLPFSEQDQVDRPVSLYAATKKSGELLAHAYSSMFGLKTTGFRFFTVYGPYGRPDMALFKFIKNISEGKPIELYNNGDMERDFTYVDDIVKGILALMEKSASLTTEETPYRVYNIGNSNPVSLMDFVRTIEKELSKKAEIVYLPMQPGDVPKTYADTRQIKTDTGFMPDTSIEEGVHRFVEWYRKYYEV